LSELAARAFDETLIGVLCEINREREIVAILMRALARWELKVFHENSAPRAYGTRGKFPDCNAHGVKYTQTSPFRISDFITDVPKTGAMLTMRPVDDNSAQYRFVRECGRAVRE
jgi:hypothetical protein